MKYLVAVSGGVDSVVLLDMLVRRGQEKLIVAHFDHGIRQDSEDDALFVKQLAAKYGLPFVSVREELGARASEEAARAQRYSFLYAEAKKRKARIVTAHHKNDLVETMAINIIRGTGWRGLAVFGNREIIRPLVSMEKADIYAYALKNKLEWVEDSTNHSQAYLRNRLRGALSSLPAYSVTKLEGLWHQQTSMKHKIDEEVGRILELPYSRYFFTVISPEVALELLRGVLLKEVNEAPTRPQLTRALLAIKTAKPGSIFQIGAGLSLQFSLHGFVVVLPQKVL